MSLVEQRDQAGRTALMFASSEGHTNLIELLLDKGSIVETRDKDGLTALCWACVRGRVAVVQILLDRGANVSTNDNTGRTPLDLAAFQVDFCVRATFFVFVFGKNISVYTIERGSDENSTTSENIRLNI